MRIQSNLIRAASTATVQPWVWTPLDEEDAFVEGLSAAVVGAGQNDQALRERGTSGYGIDQIVQEAETIIAEAQAEADRIVREAEQRARSAEDRLRREALEQARAELAAERAADPNVAELRAAAEAFVAAVAELRAEWERVLSRSEEELREAAFHLAREVVGREIEAHPEMVVDAVRAALASILPATATVHLHPLDMPLVQQALLDLQADLNLTGVDFEEDPRVERGGCLVTSEHGTADTQPSSKLAQLREAAGG